MHFLALVNPHFFKITRSKISIIILTIFTRALLSMRVIACIASLKMKSLKTSPLNELFVTCHLVLSKDLLLLHFWFWIFRQITLKTSPLNELFVTYSIFDFRSLDRLELNVSNYSSTSEKERAINYLSNNSLKNLHSKVNYGGWFDFANDDLTEAVFDNLNIQELSISCRNITAPEFFNLINSCHWLRCVETVGIEDTNALLDVIEASFNVRQWILNLGWYDITYSVVERLQAMMLNRNENLLVIYKGQEKFKMIPQLTQAFKISLRGIAVNRKVGRIAFTSRIILFDII